MIYGHGDDAFRFKKEIKANFSSNCYSQIDNSLLFDHLKANLSNSIESYPHPEAYSLIDKLSEKLDIPHSNVSIFNGAIEAIYTIAQIYCGADSLIMAPTFSEYESACRIFNHNIYKYNLFFFLEHKFLLFRFHFQSLFYLLLQ